METCDKGGFAREPLVPCSKYTEELLKRITYNTSISGTDIAFDNLKRMHPSLTDDNILAMAYVASNPAIGEEDRQILTKCMKMKAEAEYNQLKKFLDTHNTDTSSDNITYTIKE